MAATHPTHSELLRFAEGSLSQSARKLLYRHLETCEQCREVIKTVNERPPEAAVRPSGSKRKVESARGSQENPTRQVTDLLIGTTLGEYKVVERLGQGGMGVLYRAVQPLIGKEVAIKVVLAEIASDATVVQRMVEEARAVNAARHRNIIDIFSFGQLPDGRPYMVMELLQGQSLADLLYSVVRLPWRRALEVLDQCFAGLEAAHEKGVIHRDLKPDNIFIDQATEPWKVTLLDFGLATRAGHRDVKLTQQGAVVGTPGFMAPEQVQGMVDLSLKTDVYAMGVVAWTVLCGREPFAGGSIVEVMHRHLTTPAPPLRAEVPDVPEAVEALVLRMMAKAVDERPSDAEVRAEIARLLGPAAAPAARRKSGGPQLLAAASAVAVLAAASWYGFTRDETVAPGTAAPIADHPTQPAADDAGVALAEAPTAAPADPAPADPAPADPPLDAGAATKPPGQKVRGLAYDEMVWPCGKILRISKLYRSALGSWMVSQVTFDGEPPLLLVSIADHPRKGAAEVKQAVRLLRACKGSAKFVHAVKIERNNIWATEGPLFLGGVRTAPMHVEVVAVRPGE